MTNWVRKSVFLPEKQVMRSEDGEQVKLSTWRTGYQQRTVSRSTSIPGEQLWLAERVSRSTSLPGEQNMSSADDEQINLLTFESSYEEQRWWKGWPVYLERTLREAEMVVSQPVNLESRLWGAERWAGQSVYLESMFRGAEMLIRSTCLPGEQIMRSRDG